MRCRATMLVAALATALALTMGITGRVFAEGEPSIPDVELEVRVEPSVTTVEYGVAFRVTIVRVWHQAFDVQEASLDALEPLEAVPLTTTRRNNETHVEETLVFECRSFEAGTLSMPPPLLIATDTDTGEQRVAFGDEWTLEVQSSLPAENPGAIELPSGMLAKPRPWLPWVVRGAAALVVFGIAGMMTWRTMRKARRRRDEEAARAIRERPASPYEKAAAQLAELRQRDPSPDDATALESWALDASHLLRDYLRDGFDALHEATTTEEFLAEARASDRIDASQRERLGGYFTRCDAAMFGNRGFDADGRRQLLDRAADLLEATRSRASDGARQADAGAGTADTESGAANGNGSSREAGS